jgi:ribose 5-phosphate isomerase A
MKQLLGKIIAARVQNGEVLGLGSGSSAEAAINALGLRIKEGTLSNITGIPTSHRTAELARSVGIKVLPSTAEIKMDWAFDGADEVDGELNLIKGRGGAMVSEKIVAALAGGLVVLVTEEKLVAKLGQKFPIPVEVIPEAVTLVKTRLEKLGAKEIVLRQDASKKSATVTDHGNHILDARFENISSKLEAQINDIPGVLNNGLFFGLTNEVLVAKQAGVFSLSRANEKITETLVPV